MLKRTSRTAYTHLEEKELSFNAMANFFDRMLLDDRINYHFIGMDTNLLRKKFLEYISYFVLGGSRKYEGDSLRKVLARLYISPDEFDIALEHLRAALNAYSIPLEERARIESIIRTLKYHIVSP